MAMSTHFPMTDDGTYYYCTDFGKLTKLTAYNVSTDFKPLVNLSQLADGRVVADLAPCILFMVFYLQRAHLL